MSLDTHVGKVAAAVAVLALLAGAEDAAAQALAAPVEPARAIVLEAPRAARFEFQPQARPAGLALRLMPARQRALTTNIPFWWVGVANLDYERRLSTATTAGVSYSRAPDAMYQSVKGAFRYYPDGEALNGFWLGGRVGVSSLSGWDDSVTYPVVGAEAGYVRHAGGGRLTRSVGVGMTRLFGAPVPLGKYFPVLRLNVGVAW